MQFVRLPLFIYNSVDLMSNSIRRGYLPNNNTGRVESVDFLDGSHLFISAPAVIRHVLLVSLSQPMKAIAVNIRQSRPDSMNEEEYPQAPSLHLFHEILAVQTAFRFAMMESNGSLSKWSLTMFICSTGGKLSESMSLAVWSTTSAHTQPALPVLQWPEADSESDSE